VVGLQYNDATRIAPVLRSLFAARLKAMTPPGQRPSPSESVDIQADPVSNALILSANPTNMKILHDLIQKLDTQPTVPEGMLRLFTLKYADVQRVASMLQDLVRQGIYRPGPAGGMRFGRFGVGGRNALAVTADLPSNTLIVSASPENMALVEELIQKLDTPEFTETTNIKIYSLQHARASQVATVITRFLQARRTTRGGRIGPQPSFGATVTADDRANVIIVTGTKEDFAAIERILEKLDVAQAVSKVVFRVFPLKRATATKLQSTLQRLFANRPPPGPGQTLTPVTILADAWANALIIGGSEDDLKLAEDLIHQLDNPTPNTQAQVEVIPLAKANAHQVAQTLQTLYRSAGAAAGTVPVAINVDDRLNAIIVSAGQEDIDRIRQLVKKLDTGQVAKVVEIRVIQLQYARAQELANILNDVLNRNPTTLGQENPNRQALLQFIASQEGGKALIASALKEGILIVPDPRTNSLIVSAPVEYMKLLELLVKHLDHVSPQAAQIRIFNLKNADARQMALVLQSVFRLQAQGGAQATQRSVRYTLVLPNGEEDSTGAVVGSAEQYALTVTVDPRTNSLIVGGTEHYVELASRIIETLDATPAQERKIQVCRLRNARASDIEPVLRNFLQQDIQQMLSILGPTGIGTVQNILDREVSIVAEPTSNSLLISASPRYFDEVIQLIDQLDQPQPQVLIQVLLAEVTLDDTTELGVEWSYLSHPGNPQVGTGTDYGLRGALQTFGGGYTAITGSTVDFLLRTLQNEGRLEVLSRPQILAADNQEATINIGQRVPLITNARVTERGDTINQYTYENIGVILTVTPRISPDNYVKLDIAPTISELSSSSVTISPGASVPIINQRSATTTVTVQSGQSVLIGGLISTIDDIRTKKVPILGDIPGLGLLFRSKVARKDRKELLIVLTPQILVPGESIGTVQNAADWSRQQWEQSNLRRQLQRDELQRRLINEIRMTPTSQQPASTNAVPNTLPNLSTPSISTGTNRTTSITLPEPSSPKPPTPSQPPSSSPNPSNSASSPGSKPLP